MTIEEAIQTSAQLTDQRKTVINLLYTASWINEVINKAIKPFGISLQQFNVLRILKGQKQYPINLSDINKRMVTKMSNTTRLIDKLLAKAYVDRVVCPTNRRKIEVRITDQGLDFLKTIEPVITEAEEYITTQLNSNELESLNTLLNNLRH